MSEHTPLPWRIEDGTDLIWGACNPDDQSTYGMGYSIVEGKLPGWKPYKPSEDERKANAAFIVEAVNNHEALVEALRWYAQDYDHNLGCSHWDGGAKARAALYSMEQDK